MHYNADVYFSLSKAVDKSDGLAVLGVLIEVSHSDTDHSDWEAFEVQQNLNAFVAQIGDFNPAFEHFLKFLNGIKYPGEFSGVF